MNRACLILPVVFFLIAFHAIAITRMSVRNGKWHALSTWDHNILPQAGDTIIVKNYLSADGSVYLNQNIVNIENTGVLCIPYKIYLNNNTILTNNGRMKFAGMDISFSKAYNYGIVLCYNDFINLSGSGSEYKDLPPGYTEVGNGNFDCCTAPAFKNDGSLYVCDWQEYMMAVQSTAEKRDVKLCRNIINDYDRELVIYSDQMIKYSDLKFYNLSGVEINPEMNYENVYSQGIHELSLRFESDISKPLFVSFPHGTCIIWP